MTNRYTGGIISATAPTVSQSSASGVWNLEEAQYYQKAGLWPDGSGADPYFQYNTLLLHGDGTNGAQNNTFLDSSTNNFTITRNGNTTQGSFNPYVGPGCWSNYFDGSSYLSFAANASLNILSGGDFTIEAWVINNASSPNNSTIVGTPIGGSGVGYTLRMNSSRQFEWVWPGVAAYGFGPTAQTQGVWYHIAICRVGNAITGYINGTGYSITSTTRTSDSGAATLVGADAPNNFYWNGFVSNLRIIKGTALYTTNFTLPTKPLIATTQTVLLTCNNNSFNDQSTANNVPTRNGSALVSKFSPFTLYQTTPASYSGYFDGSGDYLNTPNSAAFSFGAGDFTIETWVYNTTLSGQQTIVQRRTTGFTTGDWILFCNETAGTFSFYAADVSGVSAVMSASGLVANAWTHVAVVRNGSTWRIYVNGTQAATATSSATIGDNSQPITIGRDNGGGTGRFYFSGSISNLRITKGQALYTSTFTPSTSPLTTTSQGATAANVSLLTCQSTTFIDNSTNAFTITANGNATPKRANPFTDTVTGPTAYATATYGGSAYFDGSGDYLSFTTANLNSVDFTIEAWVYFTSFTNTAPHIFSAGTDSGNRYAIYRDPGTSKFAFATVNGASYDIKSGTTTPVVGSWYHVAVVSSGGTRRLYVNGALEVSSTSSVNAGTSGAIGINQFVIVSGDYMTGYISNFRIVRGTAVYTGPFVPPAAPVTAITNTQLLLNATNAGIFDNTTVNDLETVGSAQVSTSVVKYGTGSMYFNGLSSYLITPTIAPTVFFAPNAWTIEGWFYFNSLTGTSGLMGYPDLLEVTATSTTLLATYRNTPAGAKWSTITATVSLGTGTWRHIALVLNNGTMTLYVDGVSVGTPATAVGTPSWGGTGVQKFILGADDQYPFSGTPDVFLNGYIDDFRITNGYARYTANFTPPAAAFPNF